MKLCAIGKNTLLNMLWGVAGLLLANSKYLSHVGKLIVSQAKFLLRCYVLCSGYGRLDDVARFTT